MRLFFALQPDSGTRLAIGEWRDRVLPPLDRPVPAANFHVTLLFLGKLAEPTLDRLCAAVDHVASEPFTLLLDQTGYWPRPGILWIGPKEAPAPLLSLVRELRRSAFHAGLQPGKRDYVAHLTLARNCRTPPPPTLVPPSFSERFASFGLFESISVPGGVRYDNVCSWPLSGT